MSGGRPAGAEPAERVAGRWRRAIRFPDWPVRLEEDLRRYVLARPADPAEWRLRWLIYDLMADALEAGDAALPAAGPDRDGGRRPPRTVVLHHSGTLPTISAARLSAMGLLRLYAPDAAARRDPAELYSQHFRGGRQVFYAYHWLVRPDARVERLLEDGEVGWHAGDREVNHASVGVCLAGDYTSGRPTPAALAAVDALVRERYPGIPMVPHCAVNPGTGCPGAWVDERPPAWPSAAALAERAGAAVAGVLSG